MKTIDFNPWRQIDNHRLPGELSAIVTKQTQRFATLALQMIERAYDVCAFQAWSASMTRPLTFKCQMPGCVLPASRRPFEARYLSQDTAPALKAASAPSVVLLGNNPPN